MAFSTTDLDALNIQHGALDKALKNRGHNRTAGIHIAHAIRYNGTTYTSDPIEVRALDDDLAGCIRQSLSSSVDPDEYEATYVQTGTFDGRFQWELAAFTA